MVNRGWVGLVDSLVWTLLLKCFWLYSVKLLNIILFEKFFYFLVNVFKGNGWKVKVYI